MTDQRPLTEMTDEEVLALADSIIEDAGAPNEEYARVVAGRRRLLEFLPELAALPGEREGLVLEIESYLLGVIDSMPGCDQRELVLAWSRGASDARSSLSWAWAAHRVYEIRQFEFVAAILRQWMAKGDAMARMFAVDVIVRWIRRAKSPQDVEIPRLREMLVCLSGDVDAEVRREAGEGLRWSGVLGSWGL
jgi:hypothetical protein